MVRWLAQLLLRYAQQVVKSELRALWLSNLPSLMNVFA
jgi:hypothetical protein